MSDISARKSKKWFEDHKEMQIQGTIIKLEEAKKIKAIPRGCSRSLSHGN